ncbi:hypothetical protein NMG60_11026292 [Bertholletia excelsa]
MTDIGEDEGPTVEKPTEEVPTAEEPPPAKKKPRTPREKKPRAPKTASHPPYFQMIKEALLALNDKSGSSPYAIAKHMEETHKAVLPANFRKMLGLQLKNSAAKGKLIKIKASYKLSEAGNKDEGSTQAPKAAAEDRPRRTTSAKLKAANRKSESEKKGAKKVGPKKTRTRKSSASAKPKQPKSIKSPAAKKAKKVMA